MITIYIRVTVVSPGRSSAVLDIGLRERDDLDQLVVTTRLQERSVGCRAFGR